MEWPKRNKNTKFHHDRSNNNNSNSNSSTDLPAMLLSKEIIEPYALYKICKGTSIQNSSSSSPDPNAHNPNDRIRQESEFLCLIYNKFCTPAPTLKQIISIRTYVEELLGPKKSNLAAAAADDPKFLSLPTDAVIHPSGCSGVIKLLQPSSILDVHDDAIGFYVTFMNILLRLLTNENHVTFERNMCRIMHLRQPEDGAATAAESQRRKNKNGKKESHLVRWTQSDFDNGDGKIMDEDHVTIKLSNMEDARAMPDPCQLYTVSRLLCSNAWLSSDSDSSEEESKFQIRSGVLGQGSFAVDCLLDSLDGLLRVLLIEDKNDGDVKRSRKHKKSNGVSASTRAAIAPKNTMRHYGANDGSHSDDSSLDDETPQLPHRLRDRLRRSAASLETRIVTNNSRQYLNRKLQNMGSSDSLRNSGVLSKVSDLTLEGDSDVLMRESYNFHEEEEEEDSSDDGAVVAFPNNIEEEEAATAAKFIAKPQHLRAILLSPLCRLIAICTTSSTLSPSQFRYLISLPLEDKPILALHVSHILSTAARGPLYGQPTRHMPPSWFHLHGVPHDGITGHLCDPPKKSSRPKKPPTAEIPPAERSFEHEYGFSAWFRIEQFNTNATPELLTIVCHSSTSKDISSIKIFFEIAPQYARHQSVGTLVVQSIENYNVSTVKLACCVVTARVWHHLVVKHAKRGKAGFRGILSRFISKEKSTSSAQGGPLQDECVIYLDGRALLRSHLKYPVMFSDVTSVKHEIYVGKNLDGQMSHIILTTRGMNENVVQQLLNSTALVPHTPTFAPWSPAHTQLAYTTRPSQSQRYGPVSASQAHLPGTLYSTTQRLVGAASFQEYMPYCTWVPTKSKFASSLGHVLILDQYMYGKVSSAHIMPCLPCSTQLVPVGGIAPILKLELPGVLTVLAHFLAHQPAHQRDALRINAVLTLKRRIKGDMKILQSSKAAKALVEGLFLLLSACRGCPPLEQMVLHNLIFQFPHYFRPTILIHLLPILTKFTHANPLMVRDCIQLHVQLGYLLILSDSSTPTSTQISSANSNIFEPPLCRTLTDIERAHVRNALLAIVADSCLRTNQPNVLPLLQFVAYFLEYERVSVAKHGPLSTSSSSTVTITPQQRMRQDRYETTTSLMDILTHLLRQSPVTLIQHFEGRSEGISAWIASVFITSQDDFIRSLGLNFLRLLLYPIPHQHHQHQQQHPSNNNNATNTAKGNDILFKLLWHILKQNSSNFGSNSFGQLLQFLFPAKPEQTQLLSTTTACVQMESLYGGYTYLRKVTNNNKLHTLHQHQLHPNGIPMCFRLLKYLYNPSSSNFNSSQNNYLHSLLDVLLATTTNTNQLQALSNKPAYWLSPLFELLCQQHLPVYEKAMNLYVKLLSHRMRYGGDPALLLLEKLACLQNTNHSHGKTTLYSVLVHLLMEFTHHGTIHLNSNTENTSNANTQNNVNPLRKSARIVTRAFSSNGTNDMDFRTAVKQWRFLRHWTAVVVCILSQSGLLLDHGMQQQSKNEGGGGVMDACIALSGGTLSLLDAFIFPEEDEEDEGNDLTASAANHLLSASPYHASTATASTQSSQTQSSNNDPPDVMLRGLALVKPVEPRIGTAQGPLLASLLRLSLLLIRKLDPSSLKFREACSRLRCLFHWALEMIREISVTCGYSNAFHELTAKLDRCVLATVLTCHLALRNMDAMLQQFYSQDGADATNTKQQQHPRNIRRTFLSAMELREIIIDAVRRRSEVLREALSLEAYEALQFGLEQQSHRQRRRTSLSDIPWTTKEQNIRMFLKCDWIVNFVPSERMLSDGQVYKKRTSNKRGILALREIYKENLNIEKEFESKLQESFELYLQDERAWAGDVQLVRQREILGDTLGKKLRSSYKKLDLPLEDDTAVAMTEALAEEEDWQYDYAMHPSGRRLWLLPQVNRSKEYIKYAYDMSLGQSGQDASQLDGEKTSTLAAADDVNNMDVMKLQRKLSFNPFSEYNDKDEEEEEDEEEDDPDPQEKEEDPLEETVSESEMDLHHPSSSINNARFGFPSGSSNAETSWASTEFSFAPDEYILYHQSATWIRLRSHARGILLLTNLALYFKVNAVISSMNASLEVTDPWMDQQQQQQQQQEFGKFSSSARRWKHINLKHIMARRHVMQYSAMEIFYENQVSLLMNLHTIEQCDAFYSQLRSQCSLPSLQTLYKENKKQRRKLSRPAVLMKKSTQATELWRTRRMSNYDYLMYLNKLAGRSFHDVTQYPIMPWVLCDYSSQEIDLTDPKVYRDLTKPVGALNAQRLQMLLERYEDFLAEDEDKKFLYGSHYSSPGVVLHYLIRQEPFTSMAVELQSGRFDVPDRLFFDLSQTWHGCLHSTSDVKELIPEFFTSPHFLLNLHSLPLGKTQDGRPVHHVALPPWAQSSAHRFVQIHRAALESEHVSRHLHHWIDLIFGKTQRGPHAVRANNVFHPLSYEGAVDMEAMRRDEEVDSVMLIATEAHIQNFGQTPCQLYVKENHVGRMEVSRCWRAMFDDRLQALLFQNGRDRKRNIRWMVVEDAIAREDETASELSPLAAWTKDAVEEEEKERDLQWNHNIQTNTNLSLANYFQKLSSYRPPGQYGGKRTERGPILSLSSSPVTALNNTPGSFTAPTVGTGSSFNQEYILTAIHADGSVATYKWAPRVNLGDGRRGRSSGGGIFPFTWKNHSIRTLQHRESDTRLFIPKDEASLYMEHATSGTAEDNCTFGSLSKNGNVNPLPPTFVYKQPNSVFDLRYLFLDAHRVVSCGYWNDSLLLHDVSICNNVADGDAVAVAVKEEVRIPGRNPSRFHFDSSSSGLTTSHGSGSNSVGSDGMLVDGVVTAATALHVNGGGCIDSGPYSSFGLISCVSPVMSSSSSSSSNASSYLASASNDGSYHVWVVQNDKHNHNAVATALMDDFVSTIDGGAYHTTSPGVNASTMSASVLVGGSVNGGGVISSSSKDVSSLTTSSATATTLSSSTSAVANAAAAVTSNIGSNLNLNSVTENRMMRSLSLVSSSPSSSSSLVCFRMKQSCAPVSALALNDDLDVIVSGNLIGIVYINSLRSGRLIHMINVVCRDDKEDVIISRVRKSGDHDSWMSGCSRRKDSASCLIRHLAISEEGHIVMNAVSSSSMSYLIVISINGELLSFSALPPSLPDSSSSILCLVLQDNVVVIGSEGGVVSFYSLIDLEFLHSIDISYHGPVHCLHFSSRPHYSYDDNNSVSVVDNRTASVVAVDSCARQFLFVGSDDGMISIIAFN